jgi:GNAT superfamily N-acetyltransferase
MTAIRKMTHDDVPLGMRLKEQAGWNQLPADWHRFIDLEPTGCFVAAVNGRDVGTVTTCTFGSIAWIAMMLVDESMRGRGVGRALMQHALDYLDNRGVESVRLDATPLGRPLYEKLGFAPQFEIIRFGGNPIEGVRAHLQHSLDDGLFALDLHATATDRSKLLRHLIDDEPDTVRAVTGEGFVLSRPGSIAAQIGPCIAQPAHGRTLLLDAMARHVGTPVIIDVPADNDDAVDCVRAVGLEPKRTLTRMTRGVMIEEHVDYLYASSGPEKG